MGQSYKGIYNHVSQFMSYVNALSDQSVENTGVAFVNGANERNEFFQKR